MNCARITRFRFAAPFTAALALALVAGCGQQEAVKFGAVLPLTGESAIYGTEIQNGVQLAYEHFRQQEGAPLMELEVVDSESNAERAAEELGKLYDSGARAVVGGVTTPEAMAMVNVADQRGRVLLSPSASTPDLTDISRNFYRVWPSDFREGSVMGSYAAKSLCAKTAAILAVETPYATGIQSVFQEAFEVDDHEVVETIEYPDNTDLEPLVDRVLTLKPDCVYLADYAEPIGRMIKLLKAGGYRGKVLTVSAFASSHAIAAAGEAAEWVFMTHPQYDPDDEAPQVQEFVDSYEAKYGETPGIFAAHGYDAFASLFHALSTGGDSGSRFWVGMRGLRDVIGVTGTLQFDEGGDVQKYPRVYVILEGKLRDHQDYLEQKAEELRERYERLQREKRKLLREQQQGEG